MTSPRVVHLVYDLIRGGTEGQCAQVAVGLAKQGLPHRVAVFHRRGFYLDRVEAACGPVYELTIRHLLRWSTVNEVRAFAQWLCREKVDILHAWDADAAIFGQLAAKWTGVKLITSRRDLGQIYPRWKLTMMRHADRQAVRVVANAEAIKTHFVAQGLPADKIVVLPNLLDLDEFDAQARMPFSLVDRLPAGRRLVVVNRLDPEKNTGLLIEALPLVRRAVPDAVLIVAGDGREMTVLRDKASALGMGSAVCFLGEVHDVPALLRMCEAGALVPNRNEGLSNTILEYMAAGLPVLATDCGGNRELVRKNQSGVLVPVTAAPTEVATAWINVLKEFEQAREMGRWGRMQVEQRHALTGVLAAYAECYSQLAEDVDSSPSTAVRRPSSGAGA